MADHQAPDDEPARLRRLLGDRTQSTFAREISLKGGASMLAQHLSGNRPISLDAAIRYAQGLRTTLDAISPRLAAEVRHAADLLAHDSGVAAREPLPKWSAAISVQSALSRLDRALASSTLEAREALSVNMAGWARAGGGEPWLSVVNALLKERTAERSLISPGDQ